MRRILVIMLFGAIAACGQIHPHVAHDDDEEERRPVVVAPTTEPTVSCQAIGCPGSP